MTTRHTGPCCPCALPLGTLLALGAIASTDTAPGAPKAAQAAFEAARQAPRAETEPESDPCPPTAWREL